MTFWYNDEGIWDEEMSWEKGLATAGIKKINIVGFYLNFEFLKIWPREKFDSVIFRHIYCFCHWINLCKINFFVGKQQGRAMYSTDSQPKGPKLESPARQSC